MTYQEHTRIHAAPPSRDDPKSVNGAGAGAASSWITFHSRVSLKQSNRPLIFLFNYYYYYYYYYYSSYSDSTRHNAKGTP
jgi:hypothetical protein